jgi:hypothetical protein
MSQSKWKPLEYQFYIHYLYSDRRKSSLEKAWSSSGGRAWRKVSTVGASGWHLEVPELPPNSFVFLLAISLSANSHHGICFATPSRQSFEPSIYP